MADPVVTFYENDSTPGGGTIINGGNPISWGNVSKGTTEDPTDAQKFPFHLWNDKGGGAGSNEMKNVRVGIKNQNGGNSGEFVLGTALNGNQPYVGMRSDGAYGVTDDAQATYQRIGGNTFRNIGNIPSNCRRSIWLQLNLAPDAAVGQQQPMLVVDYTFEA